MGDEIKRFPLMSDDRFALDGATLPRLRMTSSVFLRLRLRERRGTPRLFLTSDL